MIYPTYSYDHGKKSIWDKIKEEFINSTMTAAMADNPAVTIASGWNKDAKTGKVSQKPTKSTNRLAENLGIISMTTDPEGLVKSGIGLAKAVRHPIQTVKSLAQLAKDGAQAVKEGTTYVTKVAKRSKVAKQLTAPARARRVEKAAKELIADREAKYDKYVKAAGRALKFHRKLRKSGINLERNPRSDGAVERRITPNWYRINKEEDVKGIMKSAGISQEYIDKVKMGTAKSTFGFTEPNVPYVEFTSESGYNPNHFINTGDYEMPIFGTGDVAKGSSKITGANSVTTTRITPPVFRDTATTTAGNGAVTRTGFDELRGALQKDIDYLKKEIPGFKQFGSAEGVSEGALSHNTHDIDGYMSREAFENFRKTHPVSERSNTNGNTYIYNVGDGKYGEAGNIDLNIIDVDKDGVINNSRTAELYRQFFPLEYQKQAQAAATNPGKISLRALDANDNPISAQALVDAYDPLVKTIMDAMEINYGSAAKAKHAGRILEYLAGDRPDAVSKALQQTAKIAGEKGHLLPKMSFGSVDDNIALLNKIGFKGDLKAIASSPEKMQNTLDYWYLSGRSNMRQVNAGDMHENGGSIQKLFRNLTDWNASGEASGGYNSGAGLNTIQDGSAALGNRSIYGVIQPYIKGLDQMTDPNQVVDAVDYASGIRFTQDQANRIFGHLGIQFPENLQRSITGQDILSAIPNSGDQVKTVLQNMSDKFGINALRGRSYSGTYSGITRQLGPQDAIGTNAGDAFLGGIGMYKGFPAWTPRMEKVSALGSPYIPHDYQIFPDYYDKVQPGFQRDYDLQSYFWNRFNTLIDSFQLTHTPTTEKAFKMAYPIIDRTAKIKPLAGTLGGVGTMIAAPIAGMNWYGSRNVSQEDAKTYAKKITDDLYRGGRSAGLEVSEGLIEQRRRLGEPSWEVSYLTLGQDGRSTFEQQLLDKISKMTYRDANALERQMLYNK